jgi:hypothetical protein
MISLAVVHPLTTAPPIAARCVAGLKTGGELHSRRVRVCLVRDALKGKVTLPVACYGISMLATI